MAGKILKLFTILISITLLVAAGIIAMIAFPVFGNKALIVRSGSMEPTIGIGSVVIVRPSSTNTYSVGDIVAFKYDASTIVTHRIISVEKKGNETIYKTKGDANKSPDEWQVTQGQVLGKNYFVIPEFGKIMSFARSQKGIPTLIIFPAVIVILLEAISIFREIRKKIRAEKKKNHTIENPAIYFTAFGFEKLREKNNLSGLKLLIPIFILGLTVQSTYAFFSDTESSLGNVFQAAATFPSPSISPSPTPINTPTPTTAPHNLCDDINIDIHGNGAGSHNGVVIICQNHHVIYQSNETNVNTNIDTNSNTGDNIIDGNTNGSNNINTGSTSATTTVNVSGNSNTTNGASPTLTPTPPHNTVL